mmetsp:Transcript_9862/g.39983  ORF Transcript_9862/g.39983 Transcript_9862/m.39983 type:complete len:811 (-) Transcript_9862:41-2473(-)
MDLENAAKTEEAHGRAEESAAAANGNGAAAAPSSEGDTMAPAMKKSNSKRNTAQGVRFSESSDVKLERRAVSAASPTLHRRSTSEGSVLMQESIKRAAAQRENGDGRPILWKQESSASINMGSLLRLFRSEFFDVWMCVSYLYRYPSSGVHDYLVNQLYSMPDDDVEFYLVQLCTMLVHAEFESTALQRFLMDKCKSSIHFALKVSWLFAAAIEDDPTKISRCEQLQEDCEMAVVNSEDFSRELRARRMASNLKANHSMQSASTLAEMHAEQLEDIALPSSDSEIAAEPAEAPADGAASSAVFEEAEGESQASLHRRSQSMLELGDAFTRQAIEKQYRCEYFNVVLKFVEDIGQISDRLRSVLDLTERQRKLEEEIELLNQSLPIGLYLPLWEASKRHHCIVRLVSEHAKVLKSRERVPFILMFETIESNYASSVPDLHKVANAYAPVVEGVLKSQDSDAPADAEAAAAGDEASAGEEQAVEQAENPAKKRGSVEQDLVNDSDSDLQNWFYKNHKDGKRSPFGVPWARRCELIARKSPFGHLKSWSLKSLIIKYGDELRQEYLALQLIDQFRKIFEEANLTLFLKPYRILVNSSSSGLIETLTDTISIHQLKNWYSPDGTVTLSQHFDAFYGEDTHARKVAVGNFAESLAAYSLVSYIMQIKDRHNGNIMLSSSGHVIHIDFGFILSNSPGSIKAENAPFKFTQDFCDVLGGKDGAMYHYYVQLLIKGFLEVRKHTDKVVQLVEMMAIGSNLPCFQAGQATITALRDRFHSSLTEEQLITLVHNMIEQSLHSWRTQFYDRFQYLTNNILY